MAVSQRYMIFPAHLNLYAVLMSAYAPLKGQFQNNAATDGGNAVHPQSHNEQQ